MSADEDTELRDLVSQTLESNGVLGKLKAQLRASVFLALEEQDSLHNQAPLQNIRLKKFLATKDGRTVTALVQEFLEFFNLDFTLSVFEPEICENTPYESRHTLARDLGMSDVSSSSSQPLLSEVLNRASKTTTTTGEHKGQGTFSFKDNSKAKNYDENPKVTKNPETNGQVSVTDLNSLKDDDSFFDDPLPLSDRSRSLSDKSNKDKKDSKSKSGGFLSGAPPLNTTEKKSKEVDFNTELKFIDKNLENMGFDAAVEDYDDDFESSNVSPIGQTPRSARSDHNIRSIEEEIGEEIEEDLSVAEDLLKSDISGMEDLTTDRTVSPTEQSAAFDYAEDLNLP